MCFAKQHVLIVIELEHTVVSHMEQTMCCVNAFSYAVHALHFSHLGLWGYGIGFRTVWAISTSSAGRMPPLNGEELA
jgi:hypothetical protein